jgi:hypothetical protein
MRCPPSQTFCACTVTINAAKKAAPDLRRAILAAQVSDVRFWHKADMLNALTNVRLWGLGGH